MDSWPRARDDMDDIGPDGIVSAAQTVQTTTWIHMTSARYTIHDTLHTTHDAETNSRTPSKLDGCWIACVVIEHHIVPGYSGTLVLPWYQHRQSRSSTEKVPL